MAVQHTALTCTTQEGTYHETRCTSTFWNYNTRDYGWIGEEMRVIQRSFLPEDLEPILTDSGVSGCVAVQARQSLEETEWLLELADKHEFIKGVVGWVDLCSEEVSSQLEKLATNPWLKGVRHVIQDEPDVKFVLREDFQRGIALLQQHDLAYDLLVSKEQLPYAVELVQKFPQQRFVIDHLAKPDIKAGVVSPGRKQWRRWQHKQMSTVNCREWLLRQIGISGCRLTFPHTWIPCFKRLEPNE